MQLLHACGNAIYRCCTIAWNGTLLSLMVVPCVPWKGVQWQWKSTWVVLICKCGTSFLENVFTSRNAGQHVLQVQGFGGTRYFLPVKIVNRTCETFLLLPAFLFFCCVCVADQNTRALLLHAYCYCLATRRLAVTHHPTYSQHEKREAKEKWQRRLTVENRTYGYQQHPNLSSSELWGICPAYQVPFKIFVFQPLH